MKCQFNELKPKVIRCPIDIPQEMINDLNYDTSASDNVSNKSYFSTKKKKK